MNSIMYANADPSMPFLTPSSDPYPMSSFTIKNEPSTNEESNPPPLTLQVTAGSIEPQPSSSVTTYSPVSRSSPRSITPSQTTWTPVRVIQTGKSIASNSLPSPMMYAAQVSSTQRTLLPRVTAPNGNPSLPASVLSQVIGNPTGLIQANGFDSNRARRTFKPSTVWDHFLRLSDGNVQCVHCAKVLKRKDSSTKTMWGHLRAIHFKGRDWTALQQAAANASASLSEAFDSCTFDPSSDVSISGSTQSWLEEQLGISTSPSPTPTTPTNELEKTDEEKEDIKEDMDAEIIEDDAYEGPHKRSASEMNRPEDGGTPTQPYVKRNRSVGGFPGTSTASDVFSATLMNNGKLTSNGLTAVRAALGQPQQKTDDSKTMSFLASIPRASEVIKITAGFSGEDNGTTVEGSTKEMNVPGDENSEASVDSSVRHSVPPSSGSPSVSSTNNQLQAAATYLSAAAASNPFMYMAAANALSSSNIDAGHIAFSLEDAEFLTLLVQLSKDLDCRFTFECRGAPSFRIEPHTSPDSKLRGVELVFIDLGTEIRVIERHNGIDTESEMWRKMDFTQFSWAIRGKCQKFFSR